MSLDNPLTITDVFRRHGIGTAIIAPVLQLQELALAVSLQGRYRVGAGYRGLDHLIEVSVYEQVGRLWTTRQTMAVALPTRDSDQRQHELAIIDLAGVADVLQELLQEGQPS